MSLQAPPIDRPPDFEGETAESVLEYLVERFHPRLYVACSFQKEASVIMDMLLRIEPSARFFTLDTDLLFEETYTTWRELEAKYDISIDVYRGISLDEQAAMHGEALWAREPDKCCGIRKVTPLKRALSDVDCWVAGLRREATRRSAARTARCPRTPGAPGAGPTPTRRSAGCTEPLTWGARWTP
jgi:phosphoadenosine phosphosulfate reductase